MAPFFAAAHALTRWSNLPPDGFSLDHQHGAALAGIAAFAAGLFTLRSLLRRYVTDGVALAALVTTIVFGTNLFHYAACDNTFSHVFSFGLIAILLDLTDRWWKQPNWRTSVALSVVAALIFLHVTRTSWSFW